jgi:hypothetical protein
MSLENNNDRDSNKQDANNILETETEIETETPIGMN